MAIDNDDRPRDGEENDATPLAPGVWVTEATGFACVPHRAQSDFRDAGQCDDTMKETEKAAEKETEPRVERYRER
jgi:hypothetical protein